MNPKSLPVISDIYPKMGKTSNMPKERVLQFGTGMLLRALPDWIIDKANENHPVGSIIMVKSTSGDPGALGKQNGIYSVIEKGLENGQPVNRARVITSISRILTALGDWPEILACARNRDIDIIISNTTEAGLVYHAEPLDGEIAPVSFPAKLTRYLWERYTFFQADPAAGVVVLPTELLVDNGRLLLRYVLRHATENGLPSAFSEWLTQHNHFCSTLVDRIVPGRSEPDDRVTIEGETYLDAAHTAAEPYLLWAIEGNDVVRKRLWFADAEPRVIVTDDLTPYREQKLRILNGSNTMVAAVGWLAGCTSTYDTMTDPLVRKYVESLIFKEIVPTIEARCPNAHNFAHETLERFRNDAIRYPLLTIAKQYTSKMNSRNIETIFRFASDGSLPRLCILGLSAYMEFFRTAGREDNKWFGKRGEEKFFYTDEHVDKVCSICTSMGTDHAGIKNAVETLFSNPTLFNRDITTLPGMVDAITEGIMAIQQKGMAEVLRNSDF